MLTTISNLFPRPDQPTRGMYNAQLFAEMAGAVRVRNVCLVPSMNPWRWGAIRRWKAPALSRGTDPGDSRANDPRDNLATSYLPVFHLPLVGRSISWWFYWRAIRRAFRKGHVPGMAGRDAGRLILGSWLYPDGVAAARAARETGARLWMMALGSDTFHLQSGRRRRVLLEACGEAVGIVCVAKVLADRLAEAGVPREKLHVVPNGVDLSLFRPRKKVEAAGALMRRWAGDRTDRRLVQALSMATDSRIVLFVGNLVHVKGPDILLKAFGMLGDTGAGRQESGVRRQGSGVRSQGAGGRSQGSGSGIRNVGDESGNEESGVRNEPGIESKAEVQGSGAGKAQPRLLIIGAGPMRVELERLAAHLGVADRVHFLGNRPHDEVALWMNVADVLCLTSRSEGMPNVVLEARASGLPVVATPAGACPELPLDREWFVAVEGCNAEAVAAGLRGMLSRDLETRRADPQVPSWRMMAERMLQRMGECGVGVSPT